MNFTGISLVKATWGGGGGGGLRVKNEVRLFLKIL